MTTVDERLAAIHAAPQGPQVAALFDYDGTVISGFSAKAFYEHRFRHFEIGLPELFKTAIAASKGITSEQDFADFLEISLGAWRGRPVEELEELGQSLFKHHIASHLHLEVWELAEAHRAMGHTVVLASSATRFQIDPMARELGATHVLCTPIEVIDGIVTGRTAGEPLWAGGKARAIQALAQREDIDLESSFAYSNGNEDIAFLETCGNPIAVEPEAGLLREANKRGWPVLRCAARGGRPGVLDIARTAGFYSAFAGAAGVGSALGLLNRSRDTLLEITGGVGADLGLALTGVKVNVISGREHLWSARPCVFVFNHQSKLDPIVLMKLLRSGFTGVAKAEAKNVPGFGQFFQLAGVAFVERGNTGQARRALEPAVEKIRKERLSLAISPEGTRSPTPRLGRFKKGPFHIAMQAGVPMVPIVMRNVGEVMWRGSQVIRPGTVDVVVLGPVDTSDWALETIDDHVKHVRDMFVATLADWPSQQRALPVPDSDGAPNSSQPESVLTP
jgi:putative phosphoserine phosphatase/1-acylglycerol-3-phosphate O-acyltransferase